MLRLPLLISSASFWGASIPPLHVLFQSAMATQTVGDRGNGYFNRTIHAHTTTKSSSRRKGTGTTDEFRFGSSFSHTLTVLLILDSLFRLLRHRIKLERLSLFSSLRTKAEAESTWVGVLIIRRKPINHQPSRW